MPLVSIIVFVLLDTSVIPEFYYGAYSVPLTLAVVSCISISFTESRLTGVFYGLIAGIFIDVSSGTLGAMTFFFMAYALLYNIIIVQDVGERTEASMHRLDLRRENSLFWIVGTAGGLYLVQEVVILAYRYFFTYTFVLDFTWSYVRDMLLRSVIFSIVTLALFPALRWLFGINKLRQRESSKEGVRF